MDLSPEEQHWRDIQAAEDGTMLGDMDAFLAYVESGQAEQEYKELVAKREREFPTMELPL